MTVKNLSNKKGYMQIFPSSTYHKVDPISSERITVGGTLHHYSSINIKGNSDNFSGKQQEKVWDRM